MKSAILIASLLAAIATATVADEAPSHRTMVRQADGRLAIVFDVPVCADVSGILAPGQAPAVPTERDGVLMAEIVAAPSFRNGSAHCPGVAFAKILANQFYNVQPR